MTGALMDDHTRAPTAPTALTFCRNFFRTKNSYFHEAIFGEMPARLARLARPSVWAVPS